MSENHKELKISYISNVGTPHPLVEYIHEIRKKLLGMGFDEVENSYFIPEEDVYKQYGKEAPVILDRIYYLATLQRPEIGISKKKIEELLRINPNIDIPRLQKIFREYKEGIVESDDLLETITSQLELKGNEGIKVLDAFSELKDIRPVPTKLTLRSHMTGVWFPTIEAIQHRRKYPIKLFSVGPRFRREQKLDATHLRAHYGGSCVILDDNIDIDAAREFTSRLMKDLGFEDIKFVEKKVPSNYYSVEYEVFSGKIELADFGLYSRRALDNYNIEGEVFNLGFGIERLLMVRDGYSDVRELMYPQFYGAWDLSDEEIANAIAPILSPESEIGLKIAEAIVQTAMEGGDKMAPVRVKAWEGQISGDEVGAEPELYTVKVDIFEEEEGARLCGPAYLNQILVKDGNVYGAPENEKYSELFDGATMVGMRYIYCFALGVARKIEEHILNGKVGKFNIRSKMVKSLSDINLKIGGHAKRYLLSHGKNIDVRGPMFTAASVSVEKKD